MAADLLPADVDTLRIALVGNRNVGKSCLFNVLTGMRQKVANYPGVTIDRHEGILHGPDHKKAVILDFPGTNSLVPRSPDEEIATRILLGDAESERQPDVVVLVMDATQIRRGLFLLSQLVDCGAPLIVCLNMMDDAKREGMIIESEVISDALGGIPVVETIAAKKQGLEELAAAIFETQKFRKETPLPEYPGIAGLPAPGDQRWRILRQAGEEPELAKAEVEARWRWVESIRRRLASNTLKARRARSDRIDRFLLHPVLGPLTFLAIMAVLFQSVFTLAVPAMDWLDGSMGSLSASVSSWMSAGLLRDFLVDGLLAGIGAVLIFLPQILILFFFLAVLEDSGYITRAAFIVDAPLRRVGLSGRSFIPLLSSFACAVPGIMAARTIEDKRERLLTIMVAPLMTCSARLPVYTILIGAFVPRKQVLGFMSLQGLTLLSLYFGGMILAAIAALVLDRFLKSRRTAAIMELPPYRRPSIRAVFHRLWYRTTGFLKRAGTIILAMTIVVWFLLAFPRPDHPEGMADAEYASMQISQSYGGRLGKLIEPAIQPLGYDWRIGIGLVASTAAREVFVSTMAVIYALEDEDSAGLARAMAGATHDGSDRPVYTLPTVLSLLVFFMVALQCVSTIAVVQRETASWTWPIFQVLWMLVLAWVLAFLAYTISSAAF